MKFMNVCMYACMHVVVAEFHTITDILVKLCGRIDDLRTSKCGRWSYY